MINRYLTVAGQCRTPGLRHSCLKPVTGLPPQSKLCAPRIRAEGAPKFFAGRLLMPVIIQCGIDSVNEQCHVSFGHLAEIRLE